MRAKFQGWYVDRIIAQKDSGQDIQPIELRLNVVKPVGTQWVLELYDYLKAHPNIISNSFNRVGITDALALYNIINHIFS